MLIQKLASNGKLEYWNTDLGILEHFKYKDLFLRYTKNVYISIITEDLVQQIANSKPIYYRTIRKHLKKNKLKLRIKD
jgi:hypothetical protein